MKAADCALGARVRHAGGSWTVAGFSDHGVLLERAGERLARPDKQGVLRGIEAQAVDTTMVELDAELEAA